MSLRHLSRLLACCVLGALVTGCASTQKSVDYSAYKEARPRSILVLPPLNESPDVKATYGMMSQVTYPLAEAGYYVLPVALVDETFRQNGLTSRAISTNCRRPSCMRSTGPMRRCTSPSPSTVPSTWCSAAPPSSPPAPAWWT